MVPLLLPLSLMCDECGREIWVKDKTNPLACEDTSKIAQLYNLDDNILWESAKIRWI